MRRRPFFLLEVLIAVMLIGGFAYLSIHGAFRMIYQQRKLIEEIENSRVADCHRMKVIEGCWSKVETFVGLHKNIEGFDVSSEQIDKEKFFLLELKDNKETYFYFVTKQTL